MLSDNYDAYRTSSTYLYKGRNDKLCWGPVWDFDMSFGNGSSGGLEFNIGSENRWLDYLRAYDPEYLKTSPKTARKTMKRQRLMIKSQHP